MHTSTLGTSAAANRKRRVSVQSRQPEVLAVKQALAFHRRRGFHYRRHQAAGTPHKIDAGKRLIHLERSRLARLCVNVIPVIQAERHVAVFLNLEHHDVAAQRVNRSSRQEDGVAGLGSEVCETVRQPSVRDRLPEAGFVSPGLRPA